MRLLSMSTINNNRIIHYIRRVRSNLKGRFIAMTQAKECCPPFDTKPWDEVRHEWENKLFLKKTIPQLFHIPLPGVLNKAISQMWAEAQKYGVAPEIKDFLLLTYDPSPWKSELYLTITKEIPGEPDLVKLSGTFISKVFDGPYQNIPKYILDMESFLQDQGKKAQKYYFYFTTCPKCAKKYGHNYIVGFAEI
jgi:hypothetical protein